MKKTIANKLIVFILISLLTLCLAVGCTTLTNVSPVSDTTGSTDLTNSATSSVKLTTRSENIAGQSGTCFMLDFEVKMRVADGVTDKKWGSADLFLWTNHSELFDLAIFENGKRCQFEDGSPFGDPNAYTTKVTLFEPDGHHGGSFAHFAMAANNNPVDARHVLKFSIQLKLKKAITDDKGINVEFKVQNGVYNAISSYMYTGQVVDGERFSADYTSAEDFNQLKHLNVDDAITNVSITSATADTNIDYLSIKNKLDNYEKIFIEKNDDKQGADRTFDTKGIGATKNQLVLKAIPANNGQRFQVLLADIGEDGTQGTAASVYNKVGPIEDFVLPLSSAHQLLTIKITSANGAETREKSYEIIQPFVGLDAFEATTDNQVEGVTKDGLEVAEDAEFNQEQKEYTVYAPVGENGATGVTFRPVIAAGYSMNPTYDVSGDDTQTGLRSGNTYVFKFPEEAKKEYSLTLTFKGAIVNGLYGKSFEVKVKIITVSVDASLSEVKLANASGENVDTNGVVSLNADGQYVAQLTKAANYSSTITFSHGASSINATLKPKNGGSALGTGSIIGISEENRNNVFEQETFEYVFTVTAEAGNKKDIPLILTKQILEGKVVKLEYSDKQNTGDTGIGFDWSNPKEIPIPEDGSPAVLNIDSAISRLGFRFALTDGADYRLVDVNIGTADRRPVTNQSKATNAADVYANYIFSLQQIKLGSSEIDINAFSEATGGVVSTLALIINRMEPSYEFTGIELKYLDPDTNEEKDLLKNGLNDLTPNVKPSPNVNTFEVLYPITEINMVIRVYGVSTYVFVNNTRVMNYKDVSYNDPDGNNVPMSEHYYTLALNPGRETVITIVSKGTNGVIESPDDKDYTISITRKAARSVNTLHELHAYLVEDIDADGNPTGYVDAEGNHVDVANKESACLIKNFDAKINDYFCAVGDSVKYKYVEFVAVAPENSGAKINGAGIIFANKPAPNGSKEFTIKVTPENSKQGLGINVYHVYIQAEIPTLDKDTTINKIEMFSNMGKNLMANLSQVDGNGIPNIDTAINNQIVINVDYLTNAVKINISLNSKTTSERIIRIIDPTQPPENLNESNLTYNEDGFIELDVGDNLFMITSVAQSGDEGNRYFFKIKRKEQNTNVDLASLSVKSAALYELIDGFGANTTDYEISIPSVSNYIIIKAEANAGSNAIIRIYVDGKMVAENKNMLEYSTDGKNSDGIVIPENAVAIAPGESKIFNIEVESDGAKKQYNVTAKRNYEMGYINDINVDVIDKEDHKTAIVAIAGDAHGEIVVNKDNIVNLICEQELRDFYVHIPYDGISSVVLTVAVPQGSWVFNSQGNNTLSETFNCATIFSDPQKLTHDAKFSVRNGSVTTVFNFHIVRDEGPDAATLTAIENFTIQGVGDFKFDANKSHYVFSVNNSVDKISEVITFKNNFKATYNVRLNGKEVAKEIEKELAIGINNFEFEIIAENGTTTRIVSVAIERKYADIGKALVVKNGENTIDTGIEIIEGNNAYSFTVKNEIQNLNLTFDTAYNVTVTGNDQLRAGEVNVITATITGDDGFSRVIKFNVFREEAEPEPPTMWYIIAGVLGGIALILLILTIVAFATRGKRGGGGYGYNDVGIGDYDLD